MKTIEIDEVKKMLQLHYDGLIDLSNTYFQHAGDSVLNGTYRYGWERGAYALDAAADLTRSTAALMGIYLDPKQSQREIFAQQERLESCLQDAELDETKIHYREEVY